MTSSWAVETSRSTADWASSGSLMMASHSSGSRLEVRRWRLVVAGDDEFVEVGGRGGVHGLQGEVVDDQQLDLSQSPHFGFGAVVESGPP